MGLLPKELLEIKNFLVKTDFLLSSMTEDGRINASINEDEIINEIVKKFNIIRPRARDWFDFAVETKEGKFIPVNIKVSDTTHSDNLNCKLGIYYALTGNMPSFPNEIGRDNFLRELKTNLKDSDRDYYFLVINKSNTADIIVNSLKGLEKLTPNGNNLPFQCKWDSNRSFVYRDYEKVKEFLLTTFGSSVKKRANIFLTFSDLFHQYVK